MEKNYLPDKHEPPGGVAHTEEGGIKENRFKKAAKGAVQQLPEMIGDAVEAGTEFFKGKGIKNKNTQADTMSKLSKLELDRVEYDKRIAETERIKAETKKIKAETESIEIQNRKDSLEYESLNELHEQLLKEGVQHNIHEGKISIINEGDKK